MSLINFSNVAKLNNLSNLDDYESKLLVASFSPGGSLKQLSNFMVLKERYKLEEVVVNSSQHLIVDEKSKYIDRIKNDLKNIEDFDVLDDDHFLDIKKQYSEEKKSKNQGLGHCSFCGKPLTKEESLNSSMGPVCERKALRIDSGDVSLDQYSNFKSLGAVSLKKGDSIVLKTDSGVGFYEFIEENDGNLIVVNRRSMVESGSVLERVNKSVEIIPVQKIYGVCSPSDTSKKELKKGLWDFWQEELEKD